MADVSITTTETLASRPDEELIRHAQQERSVSALQALLLRHFHWARQLASRLAKRQRLARDEIADAGQEAIISLAQAVLSFDASRNDCAFRTFAGIVVARRCADFARRTRRLGCEGSVFRPEERLDLSSPAASTLRYLTAASTDPVQLAIAAECAHCLAAAIAKLPPDDQCLIESYETGVSFEELARRANRSVLVLRRRFKKILAFLAHHLESFNDVGRRSA